MNRIITRRPGRLALAITASAAAAIVLTACSAGDPSAAPAASSSPSVSPVATGVLAEAGLDGLDAREIIDALDATPLAERSQELIASVRPHELVLTGADQQEASLPMPEDEFYVSIAPYVDQTHECYFHSLTTCTGELQGEDVRITVTDTATGEAIVDETRTTFDNGFVGLWLPRDIDAGVTIEHEGLSASTALSTSEDDDATCVTTMQLG